MKSLSHSAAVAFLSCVCTVQNMQADEPPIPSTVAPGAQLVEVYSSTTFHEGPVWDTKTGKLYFCGFYGGKQPHIMRLDEPGQATQWLEDKAGVGGTWLAPDGRMLATQAYSHRVVSYEIGPDGPKEMKVLAEDPSWHQPNDLCQTPNGNIYFTDPDFKNKKTSAVYVLTTDGQVKKIITDMTITNGIVASNDGRTLYVADSAQKHWKSYPILDDGTVGPGKVFFDPDTDSKADPDGMSIDAQGNVYCTGRGGVWVVSPEGQSLGRITIPEFCANVTFGGPDGKTLYMTCSKKVYSLAMNVRGGMFAEQAK